METVEITTTSTAGRDVAVGFALGDKVRVDRIDFSHPYHGTVDEVRGEAALVRFKDGGCSVFALADLAHR